MASRRAFLGGLIAAGLCPRPSWADAGSPTYLSAARFPDTGDHLVGLSGAGAILFKLPLPGRGHAAAAHPTRPEAVGFARRPGTFAFVLDCITGHVIAELHAPKGRHFYGHGTFSADGTTLYTTENDFGAGMGVIGIWDAQHGYVRLGEFASGGVGPHDMKLLPDGEALVIANGGIETHPDMGRSKLNLTTMRPNLSYVSQTGTLLEQVALPVDLHRNSIRHLAVGPAGLVAFAMQWQGEADAHPALLGLHALGTEIRLLQAPARDHRALRGYVGSVAIAQDASQLAATSPRGGVIQIFDLATDSYFATHTIPDVCGISAGGARFMFSAGTGTLGTLDDAAPVIRPTHPCAWDNHLVRL